MGQKPPDENTQLLPPAGIHANNQGEVVNEQTSQEHKKEDDIDVVLFIQPAQDIIQAHPVCGPYSAAAKGISDAQH